MWNMKVTIILIVIGALGLKTKSLVQGQEYLKIRGRVETLQTLLLRYTEMSPGDLGRLAATEAPMRNDRLILQ